MYGEQLISVYLATAIAWSAVTVEARPSYRDGARDRLAEALRSRRNHHAQCVNAAATCFASGQCCNGLVCASFDDYFGLKPEVPGYCVREKDLQPCQDSSDCSSGTRCLALGRSSELYCLPAQNPLIPAAGAADAELPVEVAAKVSNSAAGGLGTSCQASSDCAAYTVDGSRLCCQDVRRGRQGIRRQCDRYNERISVCIPSV